MFHTENTKSDTACSRCAVDNLKQYAMMRHILFKLEYLFNKSSTTQGWKMEAATWIFLDREGLNAWRHWLVSVFHPILEIRSHLSALIKSQKFSPRDNISAGLSEDATWCQCLIFVRYWISPTYLLQKLTTAARGRLSSLTRWVQSKINRAFWEFQGLSLLIKRANSDR